MYTVHTHSHPLLTNWEGKRQCTSPGGDELCTYVDSAVRWNSDPNQLSMSCKLDEMASCDLSGSWQEFTTTQSAEYRVV